MFINYRQVEKELPLVNTGDFGVSALFCAKLLKLNPPDWFAKDSNVLLPFTFPKTFGILLSIGAGLPPKVGGLPNVGEVTPNVVDPKPPPKIGFGAPNVGGDPNIGLVLNEGACPKAGCAPNTGCSTPIGDVLAAAPPNTDVDPDDGNAGVILFAVLPKKDVEPVFDVESNIESDFWALLSNIDIWGDPNVFIVVAFPPKIEVAEDDAWVFPPKIELVLFPLNIETPVIVTLRNINASAEVSKGLKTGFSEVVGVEETIGVLGNWEFIVREGWKTEATEVVVIFPNVSVEEVVVAVLVRFVVGKLMVVFSKDFDKELRKGDIVSEVVIVLVEVLDAGMKSPNNGIDEVVVVCVVGVVVVIVHVVIVALEFEIPPNIETFDVFVWLLNKGVAEDVDKPWIELVEVFDSEEGISSIVTEGEVVTVSLREAPVTSFTEIWFSLDVCPNNIWKPGVPNVGL